MSLAPQPWHAVVIGPQDMADVQALFAEVFGAPLPAPLWQWKYGQGRGVAAGTRAGDGRLLAHYGGTARVLQVQGRALNSLQACDVMVAQQARGVLSRRSGPYATAALGFLQGFVGTPGGFACSFGFPNDRAARLSEVLGLYQRTGRILALQWPRLALPGGGGWGSAWGWRWRYDPVDWADAATAQRLQRLWLQLRDSPQLRDCVLPQRDAAWWQHRFANHPTLGYRCFWLRARWSGRVLGALALRPGAQAGEDWELLDWLAAPELAPLVLTAARRVCAELGGCGMQAWVSQALAERLLAAPQLADAQSQTACAFGVSMRRHTQPADAGAPGLWWWLTGGDTDFR
ncbi:hypothetical protein MASR1M59_13520 [Melaminivora sp.]